MHTDWSGWRRRLLTALRKMPWGLAIAPLLALLVLFTLRASLQVWSQSALLRASAPQPATALLVHAPSGSVCVNLIIPHMLRLAAGADTEATATMSLFPLLRTPLSTTGLLSGTVSCGAQHRAVAGSRLLTNTDPVTYVVLLTTTASVALLDELDRPHPGRFVFGSALSSSTPQYFRLRQTGAFWQPITTSLTIQVRDGKGLLLTTPAVLSLQLESALAGLGRYWVDSVNAMDMVALWLAALPPLVGLLLDQRRRRAQRVDDAISHELEKLKGLRQEDLQNFVNRLIELEQSTDFPWNKPDVQSRLMAACRTLSTPSLDTFVQLNRLHRLYEKDEEFRQRVLESLPTSAIAAALEWVYIENPYEPAAQTVARQIAARLKPQVEFPYFDEYIRQEHWAPLLLAWPAFTFWRDRPTQLHIPGVCQGVAYPFAAERAEDDDFLFPLKPDLPQAQISRSPALLRRGEVRLRLRSYRALLLDRPTLVMGDTGAGKTAAALITARDLLVRQADDRRVLPVYWPLSPSERNPRDQYCDFAVNQAKTLAAYLGASPQTFHEASPRRRNAMAWLLALCFGAGRSGENAFYQTYVRGSDVLPRLFEQLHRHTDDETSRQANLRSFDGERLLQVISNAHPNPVQSLYVLIDVQNAESAAVNDDFIDALSTVVRRLKHLGFIIKAFLPFDPGPDLREHFTDVITLKWLDRELRALLENRLLVIDNTKQGSLHTLVEADGAEIERLTKMMIAKCAGLPGRLIQIGQRLVYECQEKGGRLDGQAVEKILREMGQNT